MREVTHALFTFSYCFFIFYGIGNFKYYSGGASDVWMGALALHGMFLSLFCVGYRVERAFLVGIALFTLLSIIYAGAVINQWSIGAAWLVAALCVGYLKLPLPKENQAKK